MGQITILNGTNTLLNSCVSAGVNYSWCNKLQPHTYYQHDGAASVLTLNTRYWIGESTEYSHSAAEIGLFIAGMLIGVVGLALVPLTGGTSAVASAALAQGLLVGGAVASGAGLAISGISIAVKDFQNTPTSWTNIHAIHNRKFIAEAAVKREVTLQPDGKALATFTEIPEIKLRELTEQEFQNYLNEGTYTQHDSSPLLGELATSAVLHKAGLKNVAVTVRPEWGGDAAWEIEDDDPRDGGPVQLWARPGEKKAQWRIQPVNDTDGNDEFYLLNPVLNCSIGNVATLGGKVSVKPGLNSGERFKLLRITDPDYLNADKGPDGVCFAVISGKHKNLVFIPENGNSGNSTKLKYGPLVTLHPKWAIWKFFRA